MSLRPALLAGVILATLAAAPGQALEPLSREAYVNERLVAARVADRIRRECPAINANMVRAFAAAQSLKAYAQRKGYAEAEIDAFLKDRAQRQRVYAEAERYMADRGVRAGDVQSFCKLGYAEIEAGSIAGSLIRRR